MNQSLAILLLFSFTTPGLAIELTRSEHPRMLLYGADTAAEIHARIHDHPWYREIKQHLPRMYESNFEVAGRQLETKATVYVVERSQGFD